jgi:hypothetical protein
VVTPIVAVALTVAAAGGFWWWRRSKRRTMVQVYKIPISKDKLRAMPDDERALLILLGYAGNQINFFSKLAIFSTNGDGDTELEQMLSGAQTQMALRVVIGVLNEAWELIRTRFMSTPYGRTYTAQLDKEGAESFERLKKAFDSGILPKMRGNWIFHHPYNVDLTAAFEEAAASSDWDEHWHWYFSHSNYNSFYMPSEFIALHGILKFVGEATLTDGHQKLVKLVVSISNDMTNLIHAILKVLLMRYFIGDYIPAEKRIDIDNAPSFFDVSLPFFVSIPPEPPPT